MIVDLLQEQHAIVPLKGRGELPVVQTMSVRQGATG
jgi:hypothetical protein